jgi:hypothetical protein
MSIAKQPPSLIAHIESYLGIVQEGWEISGRLQVVRCSNGCLPDVNSFCTVGMSDYPLKSRVSDKTIFHELLLMCYDPAPPNLSAILEQLTLAALTHHSAYLAGEVIERENPIVPGSQTRAFCAIPPSLLPDSFAVFDFEEGKSTVFVWMAPVTREEAQFIREHGWTEMEDIFIDKDTDLLDLHRASAV